MARVNKGTEAKQTLENIVQLSPEILIDRIEGLRENDTKESIKILLRTYNHLVGKYALFIASNNFVEARFLINLVKETREELKQLYHSEDNFKRMYEKLTKGIKDEIVKEIYKEHEFKELYEFQLSKLSESEQVEYDKKFWILQGMIDKIFRELDKQGIK